MGTDSRCLSCFGTKFLGGYHQPIESWVEIIEGDGRDIKPSQIGTTENRFSIGNLTFPIVQKGDIIHETKRNRRWYVNGVKREALQTVPVDQQIGIRQLSPKDIEYRLGEQGL